MAKRPFNGSPTADGYYTTFDSSEVHRVEESGGDTPSGSSDFSTAQVTVVNTTQYNIDIQVLPLIVESGIAPGVIGASLDQLMAQESVPLTVPLYKGACYWATSLYEPYADYTFTGSGSVTEFDGIFFLITGDCTITIS